MSSSQRLVLSIAITVAALFVLQATLLSALMLTYAIGRNEVSYFITVLLMVHGALLIFLVVMQDSFYLMPSHRHLERVNFCNVLTLTRISSTPTILYLLILSGDYPITGITVAFTALIFLTDLLDGHVSRKTGQVTRIGQYLDSMSDYAMLIAISIAFLHYALISRWFFRLMMLRLLFQWVGMGLLLVVRGSVEPRSTLWGKVSVFAAMSLYAVALLKLLPRFSRLAGTLYATLEPVAAVLIAVSIVDKGLTLFREFRDSLQRAAPPD
ncbi:MAG: hypothetical protein EA404_06565 [Spirochaetaceae bacterium]|nr:MAG: hypothetical protein EA404_06565 [Spirochaetaceae bacterium]